MRILLAVEPVDGRKGIDSLARVCSQKLEEDPFSGAVFLFVNRRRTTVKALCYDGQGYWLAQKRLSKGRFKWPTAESASQSLEPHQVQALLAAVRFNGRGAPPWRVITPAKKVSLPA